MPRQKKPEAKISGITAYAPLYEFTPEHLADMEKRGVNTTSEILRWSKHYLRTTDDGEIVPALGYDGRVLNFTDTKRSDYQDALGHGKAKTVAEWTRCWLKWCGRTIQDFLTVDSSINKWERTLAEINHAGCEELLWRYRGLVERSAK